MIGRLQTRKPQLVADSFGIQHSLDSVKLATKINHQILKLDEKTFPV